MAGEETNAEAPAPVEAEAVPVAEVTEAPAVEAVELHTDTPSALSGAVAEGAEKVETPADTPVEPEKPAEEAPAEKTEETKPEAEKKAEEKPADTPEDKPAEEKPAEEVPEVQPLIYEAFKLPEGVTPDTDRIGKFTDVVGKYQVPQEAAQGLIDLYTETVTTAINAYADQTLRNQHKVFGDTRKEWVKQAMADEEIGGAAWDTSLGKIARMRDMFVPAADMKAFNEFLDLTGAGDHPLFLKMMHRIARKFDEPSTAVQGKPPKDIGKQPGKRGMASLYDAASTSHSR